VLQAVSSPTSQPTAAAPAPGGGVPIPLPPPPTTDRQTW
jgi:hypothetical protein